MAGFQPKALFGSKAAILFGYPPNEIRTLFLTLAQAPTLLFRLPRSAFGNGAGE
jgi:hypothetical protein